MLVQVSMSELDCSASFFDSFRRFYPGFDGWFRRVATEGRKAYIHRDSLGNLDGFMLLKIEGPGEDYGDMENPFAPGVRMKICSLKSTARGKGLFWIFIQVALREARAANAKEIYVTVFAGTKDTDALIRRLSDCGFTYMCRKGEERVYVRRI